MGVGSRGGGAGGPCPPWIFIHGTDKVEEGFMVLFFGLVFPLPPLENFSADTHAHDVIFYF